MILADTCEILMSEKSKVKCVRISPHTFLLTYYNLFGYLENFNTASFSRRSI